MKRLNRLFLALIIAIIGMTQPAEAKPLDLQWYAPYYADAARLKLPADQQVDNQFSFAGKVSGEYQAVLVRIANKQDEAYYYYPVKEQNVAGTVYLRFGAGEYQVEFNLVKPIVKADLMEFDYLAQFNMEKLVQADERFVLPSWGIESNHADIVKLAKEITRVSKDNHQKVKAVHDWVARNIKYDVVKFKQNKLYDNDGALQALQSKQGLCRDYSNLATALLRALNIEARTVLGQAKSNGQRFGHAWNEAKVNGRWVSFDATWDAGYVKNDKFIAKYSSKYFNLAPEIFKQSHVKSENIY